MDTQPTCGQNPEEKPDTENTQNGDILSAYPAQNDANAKEEVPGSSVGAVGVRKRRNLSKKGSANLTRPLRECTPIRDPPIRLDLSSDEDTRSRPKTPERRRRKVKKVSAAASNSVNNTEDGTNGTESANDLTAVEDKIVSTKEEPPQPEVNPSHIEEKVEESEYKETNVVLPPEQEAVANNGNTKSENLLNIQAEFISMLDKAKKKIKSGKDRYNKLRNEHQQKRSQSVPKQLHDDEDFQMELEAFKRCQKQTAERQSRNRKYSSDSIRSTSSNEQKIRTPVKPSRRQIAKVPPPPPPATRQIKRKPLIKQYSSNKIVEILDPKTAKVIKTKEVINIKLEFKDILIVSKCFKLKEIAAEYKRFKADMIEEYKKIVALRRRCFCELVLMMVLCGLGGVMFKFVEGGFENFYKCGVKRVKRDFIDLLWVKSHSMREDDWKSLARNRLRKFEEELHTAHEAGIHTYTGQRSWSFLNGVIYSLTIVTTIGYGHLYPTTTLGKGLTILYALIGIPLFLIILTDFGKLFTRCIKYVWAFFRRLCYTGRCRRVRKTTHVEEIFKGAQIVYDIAHLRRPSMFDPNIKVDDPENSIGTPGTPAPSNFEIDDQFNLPISLALSLLVLYIFLGAVAFNWLEGWSFFTSFYFVFISMSTIGFGDFVPEHHTFMIFTIVYLVFGLALMSMCINVVQDKLSDTFKQASAKLGATLGVSVNEEDGSIATVPPEAIEIPEVHNADTGSVNVPPEPV